MAIPVKSIDSYQIIEQMKDDVIFQIVSDSTTYNVAAKDLVSYIKAHPDMDKFFVNEVEFSEEISKRINAEENLDFKIQEETNRAINVENEKADKESPVLTGVPIAPTALSGTNNQQIATTAFVQTAISNGISASDSMIIKGTIGTNGTVTSLPTNYKTGWTYRVVTNGSYAGQVCEIGDLIIALIDRDGSENLDSDWCVAQTNINGAITGIKDSEHIQVSQTGSVVTISHKNVTRSDISSDSSLSYGDTFQSIKTILSDNKGHITGIEVQTITIPQTYMPSKEDIGLSNVENKSSKMIREELTSSDISNALGYVPSQGGVSYSVATESTPGLIKSGTDISVDESGNVNVKDDSHNHTNKLSMITGIYPTFKDFWTEIQKNGNNFCCVFKIMDNGMWAPVRGWLQGIAFFQNNMNTSYDIGGTIIMSNSGTSFYRGTVHGTTSPTVTWYKDMTQKNSTENIVSGSEPSETSTYGEWLQPY